MKRVWDDSLSGTNSNSPFDNGKSKKSLLFHATDSLDLLDEADFIKFGSKAKLIKEIVLIRKERLNVVPKLEGTSTTEFSGDHSTFVLGSSTNNALSTAATPIEVDEDVQPQSGNPEPILEEPVEIIDGVWPLKGNAFPSRVTENPRCRRSKSKMIRKEAMHEIMNETKSQILHDSKGSEECLNDDKTSGIIVIEDDANEKGPEIAEECSVNNEEPDVSQRNLLLGKSPSLDDDSASDSEVTPGTNSLDDTASDGEITTPETDELSDMWMELGLAIENSKGNADFDNSVYDNINKEPNEECEHSLILRDDIGYVCRICGKVEMDIQEIFEFQYKTPKSSRTNKYEPRSKGNKGSLGFPAFGIELPENEVLTNFSAHRRHAKQMRPHQVEGFRFLAQNLASDKPSGCILAHAPGSGKTFMIISFIQSFMAAYPNARPLIILPKGILAVWKTEFIKWQIEDIPLYDLYSSKPDKSQQLEVLRKWVKERSILFMGYQQFSSIVSGGGGNSEFTSSCQKILFEAPSLLILDEGHTPRNNETDIVNSISRVKTPRKVVLSGTLYQNHVREVFNILNLVHPKFLQSEMPKEIVKRIMSRVEMGGKRISSKWSDGFFQDLVEQTLQSNDLNIKLHVIKDLREMTKDILHYYKGDFLDDLPGLEDYTVVLKLTARQQTQTKRLKRITSLFKRSSVGSAIFLHPDLKNFTGKVKANKEKQISFDDATIDRMIEEININDGVKAKFFLNVLKLCQVTGEKLLVFSQFLLPLKFLERLTVEEMKWSPGLEIFMITGDSSSEMREMAVKQFNDTASARVFFGSIKACGEGISLVGASRIIILDIHPNPSVTRQAVGRAFRPGQKKKVIVYRLIAAESVEEQDHQTYFRKELISKLWFEWNGHSSMKDFELKHVDVEDCGDSILESPRIHSDVKALYKR